MILWLLLSALSAATVIAACWPLIQRTRLKGGASASIYVAQLGEIERELAAGLMTADDGRMARIELERRLLATTDIQAMPMERELTLTDRTTFIAIAAILTIGSGLIYAVVGAPGIAAAPAHPALMTLETAGAGGSQKNVASVDEMIGKLEERLKSDPNDAEGWRMLGWSRFRTDDYSGAAAAYARAAKIAPNDAETQSAYGEALTRAAGGQVTDEAVAALKAAVKADPSDARARFLLGLRKEQEGKPKAALDDWLAMLVTAEADAPWFDEVRGRAVELAQTSGTDISARLPPARSPTAPATTGPTEQDISQASAMSAGDRQAMIDGMVARLDARLKQDPRDLDGWLKLIRARRVLGQEDLAAKAVRDARAAFPGDGEVSSKVEQALSEPLALPPT